MRRNAIGGALDLAALGALAGRTQHRPQSREALRAAVCEMRQRGMDAETIARATALSIEQVRLMLEEAG